MLGFSSPPAWLLMEPTGFRMLHMDGKPGPAPGLAGFCHRAGPGVWLGSLRTWQLCSWLQHILVGEAGLDVVCPLFPCSRQKGQKQAAKIRPSICRGPGGVLEHGSCDLWSLAERKMGEKPIIPPCPACPVDKYNPGARVLRKGLRCSAVSVEALLCPVFRNGLN